jgi:hypothetical protein
LVEIVPLEAPPMTVQPTAVFVVPVTLAMNCWVFPMATVAEIGEIVTKISIGGIGPPDPPQLPRRSIRKQDVANENEKERNMKASLEPSSYSVAE